MSGQHGGQSSPIGRQNALPLGCGSTRRHDAVALWVNYYSFHGEWGNWLWEWTWKPTHCRNRGPRSWSEMNMQQQFRSWILPLFTVHTPQKKHMLIPVWVIKTPRRLERLMNGQKVPELWVKPEERKSRLCFKCFRFSEIGQYILHSTSSTNS